MNIGQVTYSIEVDTTGLDRAERKMDEAKRASDSLGNSIDKTGKEAKAAGDKMRRAGSGAEDLGKKSKRATDQMRSGFSSAKSAVVAFGAVMASVGIVRGFGAMVRASIEFTSSISELSAITGATGRDLEFLSRQARDIGRSTTLSAAEAATAFKLIASAKPDLLDSAEALNMVTREAVTLAEAARLDLPTAANALGNAMNQFGAGAEEANRFINVLAAGAKFGASAIDQTNLALKNVGAVASSVGLSFEETNAAIQSLAAGGLKAAEAGTGLRGVLLKLEKSGNDQITPSVVGLSTAIANLEQMGLSTTEMMDLFGLESITAANTIMAQSDSLEELIGKLTGTQTAAEQAATNFDNLGGDIDRMKSATYELALSIGESLDPSLRSVTRGVTDLANAIASMLSGETAKFPGWVTDASIAIGAMVAIMASGPILSFAGAMTTATGAVTAFTAAGVAMQTRLAFLFGAAGLFALGVASVAGLTIAYRNVKEAQEEAFGSATQNIVDGGIENIRMGIAGAKSEIERMRTVIEENGGIWSHFWGSEANEARDRIKQYQELVERLEAELGDLERQQRENANATQELTRLTAEQSEQYAKADSHITAYTRHLEEQKKAEEENTAEFEAALSVGQDMIALYRDRESKAAEVIDKLQQERVALDMTARSAAIYKAVMDAIANDMAPKAIAAIAEETALLYDKQEAMRATSENIRTETKSTERVNEQAQQAMREQWNKTRDSFADFFVDLMDSGSNAFDSLLKSFERMIKQMVAQWLGSGLMKLFGMGGGGPTSSGGFSLFGGGGNLLGGGGSGGFTGGGALGSFGGLANATGGATGLGALFSGANPIGNWIAANSGLGGAAGSAAFVGPVAPGAGAGFMGQLSAFATSPIGIGLAVLGAGKFIHDKTSDPDGFKRVMGGMLVSPTSGAPTADQFAVDAFASGFKPTGFAEGSQADAMKVIDQFRFVDAAIVDAVSKITGASISLSGATLGGFGVDGTGAGTFMGKSQRTTEGQFASQINSFAIQLGKHIHGLDDNQKATIQSAKTAEELVYALEEIAAESTDANTEATKANTEAMNRLNEPEPSTSFSNPNAASSFVGGPGEFTWATPGETAGTHFVDGSIHQGALGYSTQQQADRVKASIDREFYGYNPMTGEWDETKGGMAAWWNAKQGRRLGIGEATQIDGPITLDGSHASGLDRVPHDGYIAELHAGERVLTSGQVAEQESAQINGVSLPDSQKTMMELLRSNIEFVRIIRRWDKTGLPAEVLS